MPTLADSTSKLTLAVPNRNGARFLEQTLLSLERNRPYVRWWLQDSCSTDNSNEIAARFASSEDCIVSELDSGQTNGLNRAFAKMGGDVVGYINSDDLLADGAAKAVLDAFAADPDLDILYGEVEWIDAEGNSHGFHAGNIESLADVLDIYRVWWKKKQWVQPEVFFRRSLWERVGAFDESYNLAFDYEYWVRCFRGGVKVKRLPQVLAKFRRHAEQKSTASVKAANEIRRVVDHALDSGELGPVKTAAIRNRLSFDRYCLGTHPLGRKPFWYALSRNPWWLALPEARSRLAQSRKAGSYRQKWTAWKPGAIAYRFQKRFEHGPRTAYYRDVVRPRILQTGPAGAPPSGPCEIHVLTSSGDWLNLVWTLKTFYRFSSRNYALCIHEDGSLPEHARAALREHFPAARFISRQEADAAVLPGLTDFPRCLHLRSTNTLSLKVFDFLHFLQTDRMLLLDSDILFFANPSELLRRIEDPGYCLNTFNADVSTAYTVNQADVRRQFGFDLQPDLNSGLGLIHRDSLRLDWIEEFLSLPGILGHFWRIEQTLFALCSFRYGAELLPEDYRVALTAETSSCCKHYVGAIRHFMYSSGIAGLAGKGFLSNQRGLPAC